MVTYIIIDLSFYANTNFINNIRQKNNIQINNSDEEKIVEIFSLINKTLPQVNGNRKRMISVKYILTKIFTILELDHYNKYHY